jgi:hypothetical protein
MLTAFDYHDWRDRKVREWLLLLLRFAITRELSDRSAALAMADELDSLGSRWRPASPHFFLRTSEEVCEAIVAAGGRHSHDVLRRHVARIDDARLCKAFQAAVGLPPTSEVPQLEDAEGKGRNEDLWKGLRKD